MYTEMLIISDLDKKQKNHIQNIANHLYQEGLIKIAIAII